MGDLADDSILSRFGTSTRIRLVRAKRAYYARVSLTQSLLRNDWATLWEVVSGRFDLSKVWIGLRDRQLQDYFARYRHNRMRGLWRNNQELVREHGLYVQTTKAR